MMLCDRAGGSGHKGKAGNSLNMSKYFSAVRVTENLA